MSSSTISATASARYSSNISLSVTRPQAGEVVFSIGSEHHDVRGCLLAGVKALTEGRRAVSIEARKIALRDVLLALRFGDGQIDADIPVSATLRAEIDAGWHAEYGRRPAWSSARAILPRRATRQPNSLSIVPKSTVRMGRCARVLRFRSSSFPAATALPRCAAEAPPSRPAGMAVSLVRRHRS